MRQIATLFVVLTALTTAQCTGRSSGVPDTGPDGSVDNDARRLDVTTQFDSTHPDSEPDTGATLDGVDVGNMYAPDSAPGCEAGIRPCTPMPLGCGPTEICGDGLDNDCDRMIDELCPCLPGTVQPCFAGPPGSRRVGACSDGTQRCEGAGEFGTWGACTGGISPSAEACDMLDNDCNGCVDENGCCGGELSCPGPHDPRVPTGRPFDNVMIDGTTFFHGAAMSWRWEIQGGPCEALLPVPTFTTGSLTTSRLQFTPSLSGDYTVTMHVTTATGTVLTCTFVVHIGGEGLRVELCWRPTTGATSGSDLDLYLHEPDTMTPWFSRGGSVVAAGTTLGTSCNWANCGPALRSGLPRVNWSYPAGPIVRCSGGPGGATWTTMGQCPNPRIDLDGHGSPAEPRHGFIENINADDPRDAQHFRIMVHDCSGPRTNALVNVYCGGFLRATIGAAPDMVTLPGGRSCASDTDSLWRVADVAVHVDATGTTTGCDVTPIHAAGGGARLTIGDLTY